jgi:5'-deoxynucleotidase YfbR-like HD superfamily hydrolase
LWGLLHDAAEAYLCDLPRPVKQVFRDLGINIYDDAESKMLQAISTRFGLIPFGSISSSVHEADELLLVTEARDLMSPLHPEWHYKPANGFAILDDRIRPWSPLRAEAEFLVRFEDLQEKAKAKAA